MLKSIEPQLWQRGIFDTQVHAEQKFQDHARIASIPKIRVYLVSGATRVFTRVLGVPGTWVQAGPSLPGMGVYQGSGSA